MTAIDHAKKRWCPFVRMLAGGEDGNAGINARYDYKRPETAPCIADRCMAWRLHPQPVLHADLTDDEADKLTDAHHEEHVETLEVDPAEDGSKRWLVWIGPQGGYCGLAGQAGAP